MQERWHMMAGPPSGAMTGREFERGMRAIQRRHGAGSANAHAAAFELALRCLQSNGFMAGLAAWRELEPALFEAADAYGVAATLLREAEAAGVDGAGYAAEAAAAAESVTAAYAGGGDDG